MAKQPQSRQSFIYTGPVTSFDLEDGTEKHLFPGRSYQDLPTDHPIVSNLIEREVLVVETALPNPPVVADPPSETV